MAEQTVTLTLEPVSVPDDLIIMPGGVSLSEVTPIDISAPPSDIYKSLVVDIETTGEEPFKDRIIAIGIKDPETPELPPITFIDENEYNVVKQFLDYYALGGFNRIIGYHTIFDKRFIFLKALFYRLTCAEFADSDIYDIMNVLTNVQEKFVPGFIKGYSLDNWSGFLLGMHKLYTYEEMIELWKQRDFAALREFNQNDVTMEWILYELIEGCRSTTYTGTPFGEAPIIMEVENLPLPSKETGLVTAVTQSGGTWLAKCPNCLAEYEVPVEQSTFVCPIDKTMIKKI